MSELSERDPGWMRNVVDRFEQRLVLYALRWTGGDTERARDVVQETFLKLCRAPERVAEEHLAEWLYTVCRNQAIDYRRKERRMVQLDDETAHTAKATRTEPLECEVEKQEQAARILGLLGGLPENQQEVIRLKFQGGLSYKEISNVTKLTVTNVGFLIHTGLKTLRARMTEDARAIS